MKVKAHWYRFPNFGDCLTKPLLEHFSMPCEFSPVSDSDLFCIGSLLEWIPEDYQGVILGQGFMHEESQRDFSAVDCLLLRGPLTRERVTTKQQIPLGDPGLLVSEVFPDHDQRTYPFGIIPHYLDKSDEKLQLLLDRLGDNICLIDVQADPGTVCHQICQCEYILSSSLHGIIAAHAYGIPAGWVEFGNRVGGNGFKFRDYASSIGMNLPRNWLSGDDSFEKLQSWCIEPPSQIATIQADIEEAIVRFRDTFRHRDMGGPVL